MRHGLRPAMLIWLALAFHLRARMNGTNGKPSDGIATCSPSTRTASYCEGAIARRVQTCRHQAEVALYGIQGSIEAHTSLRRALGSAHGLPASRLWLVRLCRGWHVDGSSQRLDQINCLARMDHGSRESEHGPSKLVGEVDLAAEILIGLAARMTARPVAAVNLDCCMGACQNEVELELAPRREPHFPVEGDAEGFEVQGQFFLAGGWSLR